MRTEQPGSRPQRVSRADSSRRHGPHHPQDTAPVGPRDGRILPMVITTNAQLEVVRSGLDRLDEYPGGDLEVSPGVEQLNRIGHLVTVPMQVDLHQTDIDRLAAPPRHEPPQRSRSGLTGRMELRTLGTAQGVRPGRGRVPARAMPCLLHSD